MESTSPSFKLTGFSKKPIAEQDRLITELYQAVTNPTPPQLLAQQRDISLETYATLFPEPFRYIKEPLNEYCDRVKKPAKPLFIVFEGIDGSGKTIQAEKLANHFSQKKEAAALTSEPSNGAIGKLIREYLSKGIPIASPREADEQMAYLFVADRHDHLHNKTTGVYTLKDDYGCHVICSRYYFSSLAYNGNTLEQRAFIRSLNAKFPAPDLVIYIDIPITVAIQRIRDRGESEIFENKVKLTQARGNYNGIFDNYEFPKIIVNGDDTPEAVHAAIVQKLEDFLNDQAS